MRRTVWALVALVISATQANAQLSVREVTVFKDGHALVLSEGSRPVKDGSVTLSQLPAPVLGTFWPYAAQAGVKLVSATAGTQTLAGERPVASVREVMEANLGKQVGIRELTGEPYSATLLAVQGDGLVLLETEKGTKAVAATRIQEVTVAGETKRTVSAPTKENRLTLKLSGATGETATVGVMYLQKGLRWTPSYKVTIDGKGQAQVKLQATLVNDLVDLEKTNLNLVIGIPTFAFQDTVDPISLQETLAQVASVSFGRNGGMMANRFLNSQMVNSQAYASNQGGGAAEASADPGVSGAEKNEDLFVFSLKNITLKKGERMTLPVAEFTLPYTNIYTLELLPRPTQQNSYGGYDYSQLRPELAKLVAQPKAMHKIRLTNTSGFPLTTAPALVFNGDRVVAQGMMTYAARGAKSDVSLTEASDITVKRLDKETERKPNAMVWHGNEYAQALLTGSIELCSYRSEPTEIEVTRYVLGKVTEADSKGEIVTLDPLGDDSLPDWLNYYGNLGDRLSFTGLGKVAWKTSLPPGGKTCITLGYHWHYFTR